MSNEEKKMFKEVDIMLKCLQNKIDAYEEAYNKGLNDAWECAKECFSNMKERELEEVFGKDWTFYEIMEMTPQEALAKLEAYDKANEIKVGDVVERMNFTELFVVSGFNEGIYTLINANGKCVCANVNQIKKTGKHIDIQSMLQQIGE